MQLIDRRAVSIVALGLVLGLLPGKGDTSGTMTTPRPAVAFCSALVRRAVFPNPQTRYHRQSCYRSNRGTMAATPRLYCLPLRAVLPRSPRLCCPGLLRAAPSYNSPAPHPCYGLALHKSSPSATFPVSDSTAAHRPCPGRPLIPERGFRVPAQTRHLWGLPATKASSGGGEWDVDDEMDWGETSKEELVLDARMAGRDGVPLWAQSMTLRGKQVVLQSYKGKEIPAYLSADAFDLTKANMQDMYEASMWGWSDAQKSGDLQSHLARFFVATGERGELLGFVHYRFELVDNKFTHESTTAAYVLELQIVDSARRLGLGSLLMKAVEDIAVLKRMDSTMLCVFRYNGPAVQFYLNKMGYRIDQSSAFNDNQQDVWELVKENPALPPDDALLPPHPHDALAGRWKLDVSAAEAEANASPSAGSQTQGTTTVEASNCTSESAENQTGGATLEGSVLAPKNPRKGCRSAI